MWEMGWPVVNRLVMGAGVVVGARMARENSSGLCGVQGTVRRPEVAEGVFGSSGAHGNSVCRSWPGGSSR